MMKSLYLYSLTLLILYRDGVSQQLASHQISCLRKQF